MGHQHVLRQDGLSWKVLASVVTLLWQTGQGGKWQVIWCFGSQQKAHDVGLLCMSTMWLFNFFLLKRALKQELQKGHYRDQVNLAIMPSSTTSLSCISSSSLLLPPISSSSSSPTFFSYPPSSFFLYFMRLGKPPGPPSSPAGTWKTGTGISAYRSGLLLPQVPK